MSILYLCDEKRCEGCTHKNGCYHTRDIKHAVNFKDDDCGAFVEQPAILEAKDSLTGLLKALNDLIITWIERLPKVWQDSTDENVQRIVKIQKAIESVILIVSKKIESDRDKDIISCPFCGNSKYYIGKETKRGFYTCPICKNKVEWERCE